MAKRIVISRKNNKTKLAAFLGITLLSSLMSSGASAKVNSKSINGITKHFKAGKKYFSLTFGQVALDTGLIHDLRFLGVEKAGVNKDGSRKYAEDASSDPLVQLVIELFPSAGGNLSPTIDVKENFGKMATVETVASLLKYANEIRKNKEDTDSNKPQPLPKGSLPEDINARNTDIRRHEKAYKERAEKIKKTFSDLIRSQNKGMNQKALNSILTKIMESIDHEPHSLYPKHTTEQVMTAFFEERFENKDIWKLVNILDDEIVDHPLDATGKRVVLQEPLLSIEKLNEIAKKDLEESYDMDEIFALENAPFFFSLTPYKPGTNPVSNASEVRPYNQQTGQAEGEGFSDCEETSLRHILNFLFYDAANDTIDLSALEGVNLPITSKLQAFYAKQSPDRSNEGDPAMRDLWNTVVGDLNHLTTAFKSPAIEYAQKTADGAEYELKADIINSIHVLQKLFEVEFPTMPTDSIKNKQEWIKESLQTIFKKLNTKRDYDVDVSKLMPVEGNKKMFTGPLTIKVSEGEKDLFSFDFHSNYNAHSYVENIVTAQVKGVDLSIYTNALKSHKHTFMDQDTEQSLWMVGGEAFKDKITHPLYKLFSQKISDNDSRINFLKVVNEQFEVLKKDVLSSKESKKHFNTMLKNILDGMSWEDAAIVRKASPIVSNLIKKDELKQTVFETVRGMNATNYQNWEEALEDAQKFKKLEFLDFSKNFNIRSVHLPKSLSSLKKIIFTESTLTELTGLENLPNLEYLDLTKTRELSEISFSEPLEKLKTVLLNSSGIIKVKGLGNLTNVENIQLSMTHRLTSIDFNERLEKLENLLLVGSNISTLTGLENIPNIVQIYLSNTHKLTHIDFTERLEKLEGLSLNNSDISTLTGLENLPNIKLINLANTQNLSSIDFKEPLEKLETLVLGESNISSLTGLEKLPNLKRLIARDAKNLSKISSTEPLENLESLILAGSNIPLVNLSVLKTGAFDIDPSFISELPISSSNLSEEIDESLLEDEYPYQFRQPLKADAERDDEN